MIDPSTVLRQSLLGLSRSTKVRSVIENAPVSKGVVKRFVPGTSTADAVGAVAQLAADGRCATLDFLGEDTTDLAQATYTKDAYLAALKALSEAGLTQGGKAEVSVKLSAVGQFLPKDGEQIALDNARAICEAARAAGTTVTLDMEDHTTTDSTLGILGQLRSDFPTTGAVIQAYLKRTQGDARDLAAAGARVRLCKGAYDEPESVAFKDKAQINANYLDTLRILLGGAGYPMIASHDPQIIETAEQLVRDRDTSTYEFQMLYGIRPLEQSRIAGTGRTMRIYVPYGDEWYGYLMRRMAERPANTVFFLRGLATKS